MEFLSSPKNYNESLARLNGATFFSTLVFMIVLRFLGLVPQMGIPKEVVPPIEEHKELLDWVLSFGVIPLLAAVMAFFASHTFELHNRVAWLVGVRPFWSRHFILRPLMRRAQSTTQLTTENAKRIMNELYYPGIKNIDEHHVHLFWRYATQFWILFEHLIIVFIAAVVLSFSRWSKGVAYLWLYLIVMGALAALHLFFVAGPRSTRQAEEISDKEVGDFFRTGLQEENEEDEDPNQ